ncbi:MAG: autotransporter-associated beta strand repeat-containing protein [Kiritimatiellia bacterium]|jgi:autotransporter-associated beta strand protein
MKNKSLILFCLMTLGMHVSAFAVVNCTWVGNTTANWSDPENWNTNPDLPGATDSSRVHFTDTTASACMPFVDSAQPAGSFRILEIAFQNSGWTLGGSAALTLDKGAIQLPYDGSNPYIRSNGTGTNTIECPLVLGSGTGGQAAATADPASCLWLKSAISFSGAARNLMLVGGGNFTLSGTFTGADLIVSGGSKLELANPSGGAYASTGGLKIRLDNATATWAHDNQINATNRNTEIRIDGNATANLNGKSDTFNKVTFAVNTTACGTLDTGADGVAYLRSLDPMINVGSSTRIPTATAYVRGNIASLGGPYDTALFKTRRGTQGADLVVDANISGIGSIGIDTADTADTAGIVVFNGTNTYAGTTKVRAGTLRVNTQGAPGISVGKVEVSAAARLEGTSVIDPAASASTVSVSGTLAPGDPIGTLTIGSEGSENNVVMNSGSALEIRMNETGCASLAVFGAITLSTTTSLNLVTTALPPAGMYLIASATDGIDGGFSEIIGESDRLSVMQRADNKQLWLRVSESATAIIVR